ncbi:MAG: hypothetical protein PVH42_24220 [Desulfobacterales bacterium]
MSHAVKGIENPDTYSVKIASDLETLQKEVVHRVVEKELGES